MSLSCRFIDEGRWGFVGGEIEPELQRLRLVKSFNAEIAEHRRDDNAD
jgi:hypothetical protein